jgi:hypothetical protein
MDEFEKAERARMCASRRLSSCRGQLASEDMLKAARRPPTYEIGGGTVSHILL